MHEAHIPYKLPSYNDYTSANRANHYKGAKLKRDTQKLIMPFLRGLPKFTKPVIITFTWLEGNKRRDLDNICSAKKEVIDSLVKCGKLIDDSYKYVKGFTDKFEYGSDWGVTVGIMEIEEV